jgi:hypothetical protein
MFARREKLVHVDGQRSSIVTANSEIVKYEESRHPPDRFEVVQWIVSEWNGICTVSRSLATQYVLEMVLVQTWQVHVVLQRNL